MPEDTALLAETPTLSDWFRRGLAANPGGVALRLGQQEWTYAGLHAEALAVAGAVVGAAGDRPPRAVGVLATRSIECYAGILGGLYAGAAVVPLSPAFPAHRTAGMARAADVDVLLVDHHGQGVLGDLLAALPATTVVADPAVTAPVGCATVPVTADDALDRPLPTRPDDTAYVLFTSGSTGRPKGVPITHANMAHFLHTNQDRYRLGPADVCSQTFDTTFDLAMFDLFMAWGGGATLVSTPAHAFASLPAFAERNGLTVWFSVPSAISLVRRRTGLPAGLLATLRLSLFCGEPLLATDAADWQRAAPNSAVDNLYGPTELTIACSVYRWSTQSSPAECVNGVVPIGEVYPTLDPLLLDEAGRPTDGEGELCVAGPQTFSGYLDPADNEGRFVVADERRWYRTGDLVRRIPGVGLGYLGRVDHQTKIRGYRVELTELEWHIGNVPGVDRALVVSIVIDGERRLAAFYTGAPDLADEIQVHLREQVPEFMVPHRVLHLADFPLNDNRKVDRRQLRATAQAAPGVRKSDTE